MLADGGARVQRSIQTAELAVTGSSTGKNNEGAGPRSKRRLPEGRKSEIGRKRRTIGLGFGSRRRKRFEREGFVERETMVHSTGMLKLLQRKGRR